MKLLITLILLLALLCGCASNKPAPVSQKSEQLTNAMVPDETKEETIMTVDLMPGAQPETSALGIYVYDGSTIFRKHLFETEMIRAQVMEAFRQAQVIPAQVDVTTLKPPFYSIEMGAGDLGMVYGIWSDSYFITKAGETYRFDYDFAKLLSDYPWSEAEEFCNLAIMPGAKFIAVTDNGWNKAFLTEAEELTPPEGVSMEAKVEADQVVVTFTNNSAEEWGYGYDFGLRVLLDDLWYDVPAEPETAFCMVLMLLQPGESVEETYSLASYGDLPAGTYQFVTQSLAAEFTVE